MRWRFEWIWMDMEESLLVCRCLARGSWRQGIGMVGVTRRRRPSPVAILGEGSCGAFPSAFSRPAGLAGPLCSAADAATTMVAGLPKLPVMALPCSYEGGLLQFHWHLWTV